MSSSRRSLFLRREILRFNNLRFNDLCFKTLLRVRRAADLLGRGLLTPCLRSFRVRILVFLDTRSLLLRRAAERFFLVAIKIPPVLPGLHMLHDLELH
ncbi:hypothetical protein D3C81_1428720 [compost metagenome]